MGLFDWLKRKDAADASVTTFTVTTHDVSVDPQDPERREALEQAERIIHEVLTGGAEHGSAGEGGSGEGGALVFAAPAQVIVAGEAVSAGDPRALEAMSTAAAKLREHGLDELAAELEARAGAPPTAAPAATRAADVTPGAADVTSGAADVIDAPPGASAEDIDSPGAPAEDLAAAPDAPAPPEAPAPPS